MNFNSMKVFRVKLRLTESKSLLGDRPGCFLRKVLGSPKLNYKKSCQGFMLSPAVLDKITFNEALLNISISKSNIAENFSLKFIRTPACVATNAAQ